MKSCKLGAKGIRRRDDKIIPTKIMLKKKQKLGQELKQMRINSQKLVYLYEKERQSK